MNKIYIDKKKTILISLFLIIFVVGTVLMFILPLNVKATYNKTVKTVDGETISFNVFEPKRTGVNKKAIILGHGIMSNKEMLKGFAIELAAAGFVAVTLDFRGHGQSTGELERDLLTNDINAIVSYLNARSDINTSALGYFGFSMGGGPGIEIVNQSTDFRCFIGAGTWLPNDVRKGNSTDPLNILMILGRYDELITPEDLKEGLSNYTGIASEDLDVNRLYGSFQDGNAAMIYLDDNTNHVLGDWDPDFIREARNFALNTFPDVIPIDENFYANTRLIILFSQLIGGFGFFILITDPLSKLILKSREEELILETEGETIVSLGGKTIGYSLILSLPGILIFVPIVLLLFLATAGFISALLFGQAFGILVLLWRIGKKKDIKLRDIIKKPFKISRNNLIRQFCLGGILAILFTIIIYLSGGLHYIGMIPSITKIPWVPLYFVIFFIIFMIFGLVFHGILQNKFEKGVKPLVKMSLIVFGTLFLYMFTILLILALVMGSFFYFGSFLPLAVPLFLLISFISTILYDKTGSIIPGALVNTLFFTLLICTISPYQSGFSFILGFFH
ncbi:MAG: alpha/beta hydrolase [Candidatus Lokiarchaeota archaeon]|nr:alpha/beta hydrolase [Candidatus Lokiarchaeota archaeon]